MNKTFYAKRAIIKESFNEKEAFKMQQLYLHPTWEKAVSDKDRSLIECVFDQTYEQTDDVMMSPIVRTSLNYKGDLLVMAVVHNFTHHSTRFRNRTVSILCDDYYEEQLFTIPELTIAPFTSMPWTFIFEAKSEYMTLQLDHVVIEII